MVFKPILNGLALGHAGRLLTDVVVLVSRPELEPQGEWREELELLGEAQGSVGTRGAVALPALEASHPVLAGGVALMVDHEQDVALHAAVGWRTLVIGTVDVQVVVDVHRHPVLSMPEPGTHTGGRVMNTHTLSGQRRCPHLKTPRFLYCAITAHIGLFLFVHSEGTTASVCFNYGKRSDSCLICAPVGRSEVRLCRTATSQRPRRSLKDTNAC